MTPVAKAGATEVAQQAVAAIEAGNDPLNAVVIKDYERGLEQAIKVDEHLASSSGLGFHVPTHRRGSCIS
ncbi:hypothetical protein [Pseudooceanicola algae]|uniref:hypothetical protein n=1 Tax=Pseudooceanicola algae TaxID=1537215 RepID=UPI000E6C9A06|nr:hypothetical protein [Pseudooceanicola algae]